MKGMKRHFSLVLMVLLSFSCAAHKEPVARHHIPPALDETRSHETVLPPLQANVPTRRTVIIQNAIKTIGLPYKWGGRSPKTGFDCSGLIVYTHKKADILIPRTASAQFSSGRRVPRQKIERGDLVFFKNPKQNKIFHVGIYIGDGIFVHAPGKGRHVAYGHLTNPYFKKHYIGARSYL